jgi:hypothetical protein
MWTENHNNGKNDYFVLHIDGVMIGEGDSSKMSEKQIAEVIEGKKYFDKMMYKNNFYYPHKGRKGYIVSKWKWDTLRLEEYLTEKDISEYKSILKDVAIKYPSFASLIHYSAAADHTILFTGTPKEYNKWTKGLKEPLEKVLKKALKNG